MKNLMKSSVIFLLFSSLFIQFSCDQSKEEHSNKPQIENTLKSISLFQDSIGVDPIKIYADLQKVNIAIDSIGYPDAGYKLWEVISDDKSDFRFMVEGYWPDKKTYDLIHDHELYQKAAKFENTTWSSLKSTWYYRFNKIEE